MKKQRHITKLGNVPKWVHVDAIVNYHSILNDPPTKRAVRVTSEPYMVCGTVCVMVEGVSGCVSVGALSQVEEVDCGA